MKIIIVGMNITKTQKKVMKLKSKISLASHLSLVIIPLFHPNDGKKPMIPKAQQKKIVHFVVLLVTELW